MDKFYEFLTMHVPNLYNLIIETHGIKYRIPGSTDADMYTLMSSGNTREFIMNLFVHQESSSVRRYLSGKGIIRNDLMYVYQVKPSFCEFCIRKREVNCILLAHNRQCQKCVEAFILKTELISQTIGKKYYDLIFHRYYLFSHYDLIKDIKFFIFLKMLSMI